MKILRKPEEIQAQMHNVGFSTDGGNFALLGAKRVMFIDRIHDDRETTEQFEVSTYTTKSEDCFTPDDIELNECEEIAVFDTLDKALSYYMSAIAREMKSYLSVEVKS